MNDKPPRKEAVSKLPAGSLRNALEGFAIRKKFVGKGPLAVALVVTRHARASGLPLDPSSLITEQKGQVMGLGRASVQAILKRHGVTRVLAEEGGRTSRGSIGKMQAYVEFLNGWHSTHQHIDLAAIETFWVDCVRKFFAGKPLTLKLDAAWGVRAGLRNLTMQAIARQKEQPGTQILGSLMQHLVGAKLVLILGEDALTHHSANASDQAPDRHGDFDVEDAAIHVTTAPSEALIRKCVANLDKLKRPLIVTTARGMMTAEGLLENAGIAERVDLIEFEQFMATNIHEMTRFRLNERRATLERIIAAYNAIIDAHESDVSLKIQLGDGK